MITVVIADGVDRHARAVRIGPVGVDRHLRLDIGIDADVEHLAVFGEPGVGPPADVVDADRTNAIDDPDRLIAHLDTSPNDLI